MDEFQLSVIGIVLIVSTLIVMDIILAISSRLDEESDIEDDSTPES